MKKLEVGDKVYEIGHIIKPKTVIRVTPTQAIVGGADSRNETRIKRTPCGVSYPSVGKRLRFDVTYYVAADDKWDDVYEKQRLVAKAQNVWRNLYLDKMSTEQLKRLISAVEEINDECLIKLLSRANP